MIFFDLAFAVHLGREMNRGNRMNSLMLNIIGCSLGDLLGLGLSR